MCKILIPSVSCLCLQQTFEQSGVGMMSSGSGYGYNQAQFSSGHSTQRAMMMRQKSMGEFKCSRSNCPIAP